MAYEREARTAFAARALVVGEMFNAKFNGRRFGGACTRTVKVTPPDQESTGGGKMARESISLVPLVEGTGDTLVVGFIDVGANSAELRSYGALRRRHEQRYGDIPFDLLEDEYEAWFAEARQWLEEESLTIQIVQADEVGAPPASAQADRGGTDPRALSNRPVTGAQPAAASNTGLVVAVVVLSIMVVVLGILVITK